MLPNYAKFLMHVACEKKEDEEMENEKVKKLSKYQLNEYMNQKLEGWDELMAILNTTAVQKRKLVEHRQKIVESKQRYADVVE